MTGPRDAISPRGTHPGPDEILATKFSIPRVRSDLVARPRLVDALDAGSRRGLVLVCTPAGFGKTTLLATWAQRSDRRVAWLSLDAGDNDPARFWRYVVAAVERVYSGFERPVLDLLAGPDPPSPEGVATRLANAFAALPEEVVLVVDDYHVIDSSAVNDGLGLLLSRLPPQLRLVLAARSDAALPLARLRARDQLCELRAADLRFTSEEVAALLRDTWALELSPEDVAALEGRTEGWVVGLQLAAISLRGRSDVAQLVHAFAGSNRYVIDYLTEEVLERQPDAVRSFLLETSGLHRLCGSFCDAVTGRSDGQQMLEMLEQSNLFVVPLDEIRLWYRYHHLFADMLRARLRYFSAERVPALSRRAAAWCEGHGMIEDAVGYALDAGDASWGARLIEQHADAVMRRSEGATLQRWLARLPAEAVRSRPRLCLAQAITALKAGRLDEVEPLLQSAERCAVVDEPQHLGADGEPTVLENVPATVALLRASLASSRGDAERTVKFAQDALAYLRDGEHALRFSVGRNLAVGDWMRGHMASAERALAEIVADGWAADQPHLALTTSYLLGRVQRARGAIGASLLTYRRALGFVNAAGGPIPPAAGLMHAGIADVLYERDELDRALGHATEGVALCRQLADAQPLATALVTLAWVRNATGDRAGASEAMDEAGRAMPNPEVVALHSAVVAARARLSLIHGELAEADRWTNERGLSPEDEPTYPREREYLVLARVLLGRDSPGRALALLGSLRSSAVDQGRVGSLIEIEALRALALEARGDENAAIDVLIDALSLARPNGLVRVFVDEGLPMAALLRTVAAAQQRGLISSVSETLMDYIGRLVRSFPPAGEPGALRSGLPIAMQAGLVEPLTGRELEVLHLLAAGKRNQQIAAELVVELSTVKKHMSHIFEKLHASNRTQAVAHARELGLIA